MTDQRVDQQPAPDVWSLREQLIDYSQQHSGKHWTDFNIHDPGVMLLESIAYAITEIEYRAGLPIARRLASSDGYTDQQRMRLAAPETVLRMQPVTAGDLESTLSGCDPSVARVMVSARSGEQAGLYDIAVVPAAEEQANAACQAVKARYQSLRNLCEDAVVTIATARRCSVSVELEYQRRAEPERIVAELFAVCAAALKGYAENPTATTLPGDVQSLFDNPQLATPGWQTTRSISRLLLPQLAAQINGVLHVRNLQLMFPEQVPNTDGQSNSRDSYPALQLPPRLDDIILTSRGRRAELDHDRVKHLLQSWKRTPVPAVSSRWPELRSAEPVEPVHRSIGEELPGFFGATHAAEKSGHNAVPPSEGNNQKLPIHPPQTNARFQSYLGLIDALLDEVENSRTASAALLSEDTNSGISYVDNDRIPSASVQRRSAPGHDLDTRYWRQFDPALERKSRALDRLLATYGESFSQNSLQRLNPCGDETSELQRLLDNKKRLLQALPGIQPHRAAACGFLQKLRILLGIPDHDSAVLNLSLQRHGLTLADDDSEIGWIRLPASAQTLPFNTGLNSTLSVDEKLVAQLASAESLANGYRPIHMAVVKAGASLGAYRIATSDKGWQLFLVEGNWSSRAKPLSHCETREQAEEMAWHISTTLRSCLDEAATAVDSRLLLVEDILMRGEGSFSALQLDVIVKIDRQLDSDQYRQFVVETISLVCPAHLLARVHWKSPEEFVAIESLTTEYRGAQNSEVSNRLANTIRAALYGTSS